MITAGIRNHQVKKHALPSLDICIHKKIVNPSRSPSFFFESQWHRLPCFCLFDFYFIVDSFMYLCLFPFEVDSFLALVHRPLLKVMFFLFMYSRKPCIIDSARSVLLQTAAMGQSPCLVFATLMHTVGSPLISLL